MTTGSGEKPPHRAIVVALAAGQVAVLLAMVFGRLPDQTVAMLGFGFWVLLALNAELSSHWKRSALRKWLGVQLGPRYDEVYAERDGKLIRVYPSHMRRLGAEWAAKLLLCVALAAIGAALAAPGFYLGAGPFYRLSLGLGGTLALGAVGAAVAVLPSGRRPLGDRWIGVRFRLSLTRRDWKAVAQQVALVRGDGVKRRLEDLDAEVCVDVLPASERSHGYDMGRNGGCRLVGWHLNNPQRARWEARRAAKS
jgi:hypothetical protein